MTELLRGVVLKAAPFNESDIILTLLTAEKGRIRCIVRRARRSKKSKLYAEPFSLSSFSLFRNRGMYICDDADLEQDFYGIRSDIKNMAIGQYFLETATLLPEDSEGAEPFMKLLLNCLALLSFDEYRKKVQPEVVKLVYEVEYLRLSGLCPDFSVCGDCGGEPCVWSFERGLLCGECAKVCHGIRYPLSPASVSALRYISSREGLSKFAFEMNPEALLRLGDITEKYMVYALDARFRSLDFYRTNI